MKLEPESLRLSRQEIDQILAVRRVPGHGGKLKWRVICPECEKAITIGAMPHHRNSDKHTLAVSQALVARQGLVEVPGSRRQLTGAQIRSAEGAFQLWLRDLVGPVLRRTSYSLVAVRSAGWTRHKAGRVAALFVKPAVAEVIHEIYKNPDLRILIETGDGHVLFPLVRDAEGLW